MTRYSPDAPERPQPGGYGRSRFLTVRSAPHRAHGVRQGVPHAVPHGVVAAALLVTVTVIWPRLTPLTVAVTPCPATFVELHGLALDQ